MESISNLIKDYKPNKAPAPHEKAQSVNEIIALLGESKMYNFGYWLKKIGTVKYGTVMTIIKEAKDLDKKYNRGGFITNRLKQENATK